MKEWPKTCSTASLRHPESGKPGDDIPPDVEKRIVSANSKVYLQQMHREAFRAMTHPPLILEEDPDAEFR